MKARYRFISLAAALVFAPLAFAQSNGVTDAEIDAAIQTLKETADPDVSVQSGFGFKLKQAKITLARYPEQSLDKLAALLDENVVQIRLNAAISLAGIAASGHEDPKLIENLRRCLGDSSIAIVYWGLTAMTDRNMPDEARREAVARCLDKRKPQIVRLTAITLAQEQEIKTALPWLVEYMKELLPDYDAKVKDRLAIKEVVTEGAAERGPRVLPGAGGVRRGLVPGGPPGMPGMPGMPGIRPPEPGMDPARAVEAAPTRKEVIVGYIDPEKAWKDGAILADHIRDFETIPVVRELHTTGLAVESLAKRDMRDMPFTKELSFEYNPPWKFKPCVEAAVAWLDENRDQFDAWPESEAPPAAEAEAPADEADEVETPADEADEVEAPADEADEADADEPDEGDNEPAADDEGD